MFATEVKLIETTARHGRGVMLVQKLLQLLDTGAVRRRSVRKPGPGFPAGEVSANASSLNLSSNKIIHEARLHA
jgi:hypothetical protein